MTPYAQQFIPEKEIRLFQRIRQAVEQLPDIDLGKDEKGNQVMLSCHMLARAVSRRFRIRYVDGYFAHVYEHSWLATRTGHIIDVYPIAVLGGPFLMATNGGSPSHRLYDPVGCRPFSRGTFSKPWFRRAVRRIIKNLK